MEIENSRNKSHSKISEYNTSQDLTVLATGYVSVFICCFFFFLLLYPRHSVPQSRLNLFVSRPDLKDIQSELQISFRVTT